MSKKLTWTAVALVAAFAIAVSAVAYTNSIACDKNAKNASAKASSCDKAAKTASASSCSQAASASACSQAASASTCSAHAKTASAGCCEGKAAEAGYSKAEGCCKADASQQAALKKIVTDLPFAERHRVVVAGTMECGHCTYKATAKCQPLFKTADGKVYPLIQNHLVKDMRHGKAGTFEVSSNVKVVNGIKYLDVKSFRSM